MTWGFFMAKNMYTYLKSVRLFVMSFDDVMFFFCELKPESLAETIVRLKFLREMQGCTRSSLGFLSFMNLTWLLPSSVQMAFLFQTGGAVVLNWL